MAKYKLLTPGPLTTTKTVKEEMLVDSCTWDDDYKQITQDIRTELLKIAGVDQEEYTSILMQGSGTFGVESVLTTLTSAEESKMLIITNGKYGDRIVEIAERANRDHKIYSTAYHVIPDVLELEEILKRNPEITHVLMVHCETTSGILNPLDEIGELVNQYNKIFIVDAMSSFGGTPINFENIDVLISSANKCIQGVPGFSFVIVKKELIENSKGNATTISLDLYEQYITMKNGKWRYTSPTHVVLAFKKALEELRSEGGVQMRYQRYIRNQEVLSQGMQEMGFIPYIDPEFQSPIITSFLYPEHENIVFKEMYAYLKNRGYIIYPGKLTEADTFRIGNIGDIDEEDMKNVVSTINDYLSEINK